MKYIKLDKVSFRYEDKVIFDEINIKFNTGITFLIGNNGSAKSTLLKIIGKKLPFLGDIKFDINKNVEIFYLDTLYVNSLTGSINKLLNEDVIELLDLELYKDDDVSSLSFPLRIKVSLGILLMSNSSYIIIDNMLCWLNKIDKELILKQIKKVFKNSVIIISTNNLEDTLNANRIVLLKDGKVLLEKDIKEFYTNEKILVDNGFILPFIVDLSLKLELYNIVDKIYFDQRKLVNNLWK